MNTVPDPTAKGIKTLDKDLRRISLMEQALAYTARPLVSVGLALVFVVVAASVIGAYMALNIGANDVAKNMGPAVGARAVTLGGAIAALFLAFIHNRILYREDRIAAARR